MDFSPSFEQLSKLIKNPILLANFLHNISTSICMRKCNKNVIKIPSIKGQKRPFY